jgi:hypothetical protein
LRRCHRRRSRCRMVVESSSLKRGLCGCCLRFNIEQALGLFSMSSLVTPICLTGGLETMKCRRTSTRKAGFDAHVVKPVDPQLIESMLRTLVPGLSESCSVSGRKKAQAGL